MNIILYTLIFFGLDIILRFVSRKTIRFSGLDVLFFASWLAGINYGISQGVIVAVVLVVGHAFLRPSKAQYILFSIPAQISAVALGYFFGMSKFTLSLVVYQIINTGLMFATGGFGMRFIIFLVVNSSVNIVVHNVLAGFG